MSWHEDEDFMAVAAVAWPRDLAAAQSPSRDSTGGNAAARLRHRHEGFRVSQTIAAEVEKLQTAVDALRRQAGPGEVAR